MVLSPCLVFSPYSPTISWSERWQCGASLLSATPSQGSDLYIFFRWIALWRAITYTRVRLQISCLQRIIRLIWFILMMFDCVHWPLHQFFKMGWWSFTLCVIQLTDTECKLNPSSSSQPEIGYTLAMQDLYKDEIFHFIYYISSHAQRDRINTFYLDLVSIYHVGKCSWSWNKIPWCYIVPHTQFPL